MPDMKSIVRSAAAVITNKLPALTVASKTSRPICAAIAACSSPIPMPTDDELNRYYADTYRAEYQFAFVRPRKTHQNKKKREAIRRAGCIEKALGGHKELRSLDFGCGSGELVRELASLGYNASGFEQGVDYGTFAKTEIGEKGEIHVGSWREMTFAPKSFDLISFLHVLEHLNDPMAALRQVHEWLDDGGVLYLETPDMQGYKIKGFDCFHFAHVLGFSRANLLDAAKRAGFALLQEDEATSFFLVKDGDPRAIPMVYDLKGTAQQNFEEFSAGVTPGAYARRHAHRIRRMIKTELRTGR